MPGGHRVGVHHPRHGLLIGPHIGSGDVLVGADQGDQLRGVAPGQTLELSFRVGPWIDLDTALRAAVGQVEKSALPRHPHGQRPDLVKVHVGGVSDSSLRRASRDVVLDAVPDIQVHRAVVASQRDGDCHLLPGGFEHAAHSFVEAEELDRLGELCPSVGEGVLGRGHRAVSWTGRVEERELRPVRPREVGGESGLVSECLLKNPHALDEQLVWHGDRR